MSKDEEKGWMEGRTRHVRVYLTEEEHAVVRAAAAQADVSVSRYSVEAIIDAARRGWKPGASEKAKPSSKKQK